MPLTSIAFLLWFTASCLAALLWPLIGVLGYMAIYHLYPETTWWGTALAGLGLRYSLILAMATAIGYLFWLRRSDAARPLAGLELLLLAFLANLWLSPLLGLGWSDLTYAHLEKVTKVFIFVLLLTRVVADLRSYRLVVLLLVAGALYFGWQCKTAPASSFYGGRLNGIGGPDFREASGLGLHLAVMLPLVGSFFLQPSWPCKAFAFLAGAFACNGIILTQTRSAFIGLMAGLTAALLWARQALRKRVLLGVCLALAGGLILTDQSFWTRMQTILQARKDISADTRLAIWRSSLSIWADHPLGVGVGNFERVIGHYNPDLAHKDAHSILVECYGELGILGLAIFLLVVRAAFSELRLAEKLGQPLNSSQAIDIHVFSLRIAMVVYLFGGLTCTRLYTESFWWILALPLCLRRAVQHALAAAQHHAPASLDQPSRALAACDRPALKPSLQPPP